MATSVPTPPSDAKAYILTLLEPAFLLALAVYQYGATCLEAAIKRGQPLAPLFRAQEIRDEAFGKFWVKFSVPTNGEFSKPNPSKLEGSAALIPPLLALASGIVLDIGPGTGSQMPFLHAPAIRSIYGAEPCMGLHADLRRRILSEDLDGKYHVVPASVEKRDLLSALEKMGVYPDSDSNTGSHQGGIFDTIICVRVLCSVPDPAGTISDLYDLLRPGGKMLVVEHVVNMPWPWSTKGSIVARFLQIFYHLLGWPFFVGDCHLNRDTTSFLINAADRDGGWGSMELEKRWEWSSMPYVSGMLVKKN